MKTKYLLTLVIVVLTTNQCFSQSFESKKLNGYLYQKASEKIVQFGAIKNMKTGEVTLTDDEGFFEIYGAIGDTLRFHSLGFKDTTWIVPGIWFSMDESIKLNAEPNVYSLDEVEVVRYYSYAHFKQAFKDLRLEKTDKEKAKEKIDTWQNSFSEAIAWGKADAKASSGTFGLTLAVGGKDKIVKQREEVNRLEKIQDKSRLFNYFVSRDNIMRLTEYEGTCLDSFMVFLNTSYGLNYQMPEYELLASILRASDEFKNLKGNEDWFFQISE